MPLSRGDLDHVLEHCRSCWPALSGERLFITGATGFVGKWLLESLLWANDELDLRTSIVALTRDPDRFRAEAWHLASHRTLTLLRGDAAEFSFPPGSFRFVVHAATTSPPSFDADVAATRHVLDFARQAQTERLLFTSSGAIYGRQPPDLAYIPEDFFGEPVTEYGRAKRASESLCAGALIARLFAFSGPYLPLDANYAIGNFVGDALKGGPIRIKGDGTPYRSYLYGADLAVWLWTILVRGESGRPYNVGSDQAVTIAELAAAMTRAIAPDARIEVAQQPKPGVPPQRYVPSVERARIELGLLERVSLEEGIRRMVDKVPPNLRELVSTRIQQEGTV